MSCESTLHHVCMVLYSPLHEPAFNNADWYAGGMIILLYTYSQP